MEIGSNSQQDYSQQRASSGSQVQELGLLSLFAFKAKELNEVRELAAKADLSNMPSTVIRSILQRAVRISAAINVRALMSISLQDCTGNTIVRSYLYIPIGPHKSL